MITIPAPMRATEGVKPFTDPAWIYEVKYDGYRCMARFGGGQPPELRTKSGVECTAWFPEIADLLAVLPGGPHVVDGEACVLDEIGLSDFQRLQGRARRRRWVPGADQVTFCAFDLLYLDGRSVMAAPLVERKAMLQQLLAPPEGHAGGGRRVPRGGGSVRPAGVGREARRLRGQARGQRLHAGRAQLGMAQDQAPRLAGRAHVAEVMSHPTHGDHILLWRLRLLCSF
jgi:hypothetical protein